MSNSLGRSAWFCRLQRLWTLVRTFPMRARFMTRLLAHYQLATKPPVGGAQGFRLFDERAFAAPFHRMVSLRCGFCGHRFIVQILSSLDLLASDWFCFAAESRQGPSEFFCLHCEQRATPRVAFLGPR